MDKDQVNALGVKVLSSVARLVDKVYEGNMPVSADIDNILSLIQECYISMAIPYPETHMDLNPTKVELSLDTIFGKIIHYASNHVAILLAYSVEAYTHDSTYDLSKLRSFLEIYREQELKK